MTSTEIRSRLIVALDLPFEEARKLLCDLVGRIAIVKIGIEAINGGWAQQLAKEAREMGFSIFWDAKLYDAPSRVKAAIQSAMRSASPSIITVACVGGFTMMQEAVAGRDQAVSKGDPYAKIFGVTIPTTAKWKDMYEIFDFVHTISKNDERQQLAKQSMKLAEEAQWAKCDGIVASGRALKVIREQHPLIGDSSPAQSLMEVIVPGVRPVWGFINGDDQAETVTPKEVFEAGANYIVIGRPVTQSSRFGLTPVEALNRIIAECEEKRR